ncbi:phytoene desaturase family protein [Halobacillus sp. ACCC02827]|uniref:phytoene desaturase family protein n=1 Tax=Bacillaceae TaxID=186817 RepID=UPI0004257738|nr:MULTISPECIES: phytoene desaturase family protein [Bacillaceae]QHT46452.1 phytoene desaturase [Bacillus sp. SB49]WJE17262.1 phytoene desaturase family protein [Halobacillus sp. ACCC02827]
MRKIAVIGAGPGGLASAMILASQGYEVDVYEKQAYVGGRNGHFQLGDYTFDIGPTFLSMPQIMEEIFEMSGRNVHDYMDLRELSPMYELQFDGKRVPMYRDREKMLAVIRDYFPGNERGYERFMEDTGEKMQALMPLLQTRHHRLMDYASRRALKALPKLSLGKSVYDVLSEYFTDEKLKIAFTFQAKYLGMSPWECPGAFSILSYMEHEWGVFHPIGGVNQLTKAMAKVTEEHGGRIHLNSGVKRIAVDGKRITGLELENGDSVIADEYIINADFAEAMSNLVDDGALKKHSRDKLDRKKFSCSTFMIYVGLDKKYDMPHHTILFADDYKKNVEEMTKDLVLSDEPSIYIHNASVTDPTLAPDGHSAVYILAPVPNNYSDIDWDGKQEAFKELVYDEIEKKTGFHDIREHVVVEKVLTPKQWQTDHYVHQGATFSMGHQLSQMMYFRPHNRFQELDHCWLVGGGTHPGSGLPTILESARITTGWIREAEVQPS